MVKLPNRQNTLGQNRSNPTGLPSGAVRSPLEGLGAGMQKLARNLEIVEKGKKDAEKILEINRAKGLMRARFMEIDDELRDRKHGKVDSSEFLKREANKYTTQMMKEEFKPEYHAEIDVVKQSLLNIQTVKTMQFEREDRTARVKTGISRVYNETASAISQDPDNYERLMEEGSLTLAGTLSALNMNQSDAHDEMEIQKREWVESAIESYSFKGQMSKAFALLEKEGARFADHNKIKEDIRKGYLANQKFIDGQADKEIKRAKEKALRTHTNKAEAILLERILNKGNVEQQLRIDREEEIAMRSGVLIPSKSAKRYGERLGDANIQLEFHNRAISGKSVKEMKKWFYNDNTQKAYTIEARAKVAALIGAYEKGITRTSTQLFGHVAEYVENIIITEKPKTEMGSINEAYVLQKQLHDQIIIEMADIVAKGDKAGTLQKKANELLLKYGIDPVITTKIEGMQIPNTSEDIVRGLQMNRALLKKIAIETAYTGTSTARRSELLQQRKQIIEQQKKLNRKLDALKLKKELRETPISEERLEDTVKAAKDTMERFPQSLEAPK